MSIKTGDRMPSGTFDIMSEIGKGSITTDELFDGKKVVLFAVPGAFTPTCSLKHLPGFGEQARAIKAKGVDTVACMAVNDVFVMSAWGKATVPDGSVLMLADGSADYTKALGLDFEASGMGTRARRFSMIVDDGVVTALNVEPPGQFGISSAETILEQLD
jgi:glutaredoxin/glutathione-dependent peroxiredoxin